MLSCPRFDPYTNRPDGCTAISAVVFAPVNDAGNVVLVAPTVNTPRSGCQPNAVIVDDSSLIAYSQRPEGENAMWRGPAPGFRTAAGGSCAESVPWAASNR